MTCGWCGAAVTAEIRKEKYVYYHCAKRRRRESFVNEARLTEMFAAHVRRLQLPEDHREAFIASLRSSRRDIEQDARERVVGGQTRLERLGKLINAAATAVEVFTLATRACDRRISREPREQRPFLDVLFPTSALAEGGLSATWRRSLDPLALSADPETDDGGDPGSQDRRHSVWLGWPNAYRTWWLDPKGWGTEKVLAFEGQFSPKPEASQAPA